MPKPDRHTPPGVKPVFFEHILTFGVLAFLLSYLVINILVKPYVGVGVGPAGNILVVYVYAPEERALLPGDLVLAVDGLEWQEFRKRLGTPLYNGVQPGDTVQYTIQRGGETLTVDWTAPGFTWNELNSRLVNIWWMGFIFWAFGAFTVFALRPKDERWKLLVAFCYLTAVFFMSSALAAWHYALSAYVMIASASFCLPLYWQLHWYFPRRLSRAPRWIWWLLYALTAGLVLAMFSGLIPYEMYLLLFLLALAGSGAILIVHLVRLPGQRRDILLLLIGFLLAAVPAGLLAVSRLTEKYQSASILDLLGFAFIPAVYLFVIYRRRLGALELRVNRVLILYAYFLLLLVVNISLVSLLFGMMLLDDPESLVTAYLVLSTLVMLFALPLFPRFERWVDEHILHMPLPSELLLREYSERLSLSLSLDEVVTILKSQVLPSLLVRQAALLRIDASENRRKLAGLTRPLQPVFSVGITARQTPDPGYIARLVDQAGQMREQPAHWPGELPPNKPCSWVRLILPLRAGGTTVGLLLLGRRDPDDYYAAQEIQVLQTLMDQTALALLNIEQASNLHALFQDSIAQQEAVRRDLASELHDAVLQEMARLMHSAASCGAVNDTFESAYEASVEHIRAIISGLRPKMLDFGLRMALDQLLDEAVSQVGGPVKLSLDIPPSAARYPEEVEAHLYRIVQQACQNALQHAQATEIHIRGRLEEDQVEIYVEDDGVGFPNGMHPDLRWLLANQHFGLVSMYERAVLIGAHMSISSTPGRGTTITILWPHTNRPSLAETPTVE